jgi:hypothetical protein
VKNMDGLTEEAVLYALALTNDRPDGASPFFLGYSPFSYSH